jgi:hypothetical protein
MKVELSATELRAILEKAEQVHGKEWAATWLCDEVARQPIVFYDALMLAFRTADEVTERRQAVPDQEKV